MLDDSCGLARRITQSQWAEEAGLATVTTRMRAVARRDTPTSTEPGWGALIATSLACRLHQLTAIPDPDHSGLLGLDIRDGKAMIATVRHRLIRVPCTPDPPRRPTDSCACHPTTTCSPRS